MQQGGSVLLAGVRCTIQYVSSKGMLDLKGEDGEVHYGVDPASVELIKAPSANPAAGSYVQLDGVRCKVQYVSSKGQLDLKSLDGEVVQYGVDPATVTMEQALAAAPAPEPAPRQHASNYGNNALMGTSITLWEGGRGLIVTVVEVDNDSGKNLARARPPSLIA